MAAASRCHMSTLRLQFVSTRGAFSYATFSCLPGCLPACSPVPPEINHTPAWPPKMKSTKKTEKNVGVKWGKKKREKKKNETENKAGKVCNAIFFIDFHVRLLGFVCARASGCVRMSECECVCVSASVKCAEWHIVFQSVASADR